MSNEGRMGANQEEGRTGEMKEYALNFAGNDSKKIKKRPGV